MPIGVWPSAGESDQKEAIISFITAQYNLARRERSTGCVKAGGWLVNIQRLARSGKTKSMLTCG